MKAALETAVFAFVLLVLNCPKSVVSTDEGNEKSVMEGESATLNPDLTQIQGINDKVWTFQQKGSTTAEVIEDVEILKDRLKINDQTGSLTINNMKTKHTGFYTLQIDHNKGNRLIQFTIAVREVPPVIEAHKADTKSLSAKEGVPAILYTDITKLHGDELIVWRFGDEGKLLAKEDKETKSSPYYGPDETFRDRLELNDQTGSLTIKNIKDKDAGLYTVKISSNKQITYKKFIVTVSGSGLSPYGIAANVVIPLLVIVAATAVAVAVYCYYSKTSKLEKTMVKISNHLRQLSKDSNYLKQLSKELSDIAKNELSQEELLNISENLEQLSSSCDENLSKISEDVYQLHGKIVDNFPKIIKKMTRIYVLNNPNRALSPATPPREDPVEEAERKIYHTAVGQDVTIKNETELLEGDRIEWRFDNSLIFVTKSAQPFPGPDGMFTDRLQVDKKTGSLTIKNITKKHTGDYQLKIIAKHETKAKATITFTVNIKTPDGKQVESSAAEESRLLPEDGQDAVYANERSNPV